MSLIKNHSPDISLIQAVQQSFRKDKNKELLCYRLQKRNIWRYMELMKEIIFLKNLSTEMA